MTAVADASAGSETNSDPFASSNGTNDEKTNNRGQSAAAQEALPKLEKFTDEELDSMLYEWDDGVYPVREYHVKAAAQPPQQRHANDEANTGDEADEEDEEGYDEVYLDDFNTEEEAYVIEFYQPWCPHCQHYKPTYIEIAAAVTRRAVGTKVNFFAVSCELYANLCHTYEVHGYPTIFGYGIGSDPFARGIELNGEDVPEMSAESIGDLLSIEMAHEQVDGWKSSYSNSEDQRNREREKKDAAAKAAELKHEWQSFPSSLNDRYHNAGLSLAFALKTGVYNGFGKLSDDRALALSDFLELIDWTTPQTWSVRTELVKELRLRFHDVVISSKSNLIDMVERNQELHELKKGDAALDHLWGYIDAPRRPKRRNTITGLGGDVPDTKRTNELTSRNRKWTEACTHGLPAHGFTCGLWDLFHIISIGASFQDHQLYGFHAGYLTSHRDVALTIRNFVANFFACDVCRWNFLDMFDNCGHDHCNRLPSESSIILGESGDIGRGAELVKELPLWLFQVHNAVNVRLMGEAAARDNREVTMEERRAALFPPDEICPGCWTNVETNEYDPDAVYKFLKSWYWPKKEDIDAGFASVLNRNLLARGIRVVQPKATLSSFFLTISITMGIFGCIIKLASVFGWGASGGKRRRYILYPKNHASTTNGSITTMANKPRRNKFRRPPA